MPETITKRKPPFQLRGLSPEAIHKLQRGAQMRGWTIARYITALVELHEDMREIADSPRDIHTPKGCVQQQLTKLGLQSVRE